MTIIHFLWVILFLYVKEQVSISLHINLFSVIGGVMYLKRLQTVVTLQLQVYSQLIYYQCKKCCHEFKVSVYSK